METKGVIRAVAIEPTNCCNLSCSMCWSQNPQLHAERPRGYMSWQLFKKAVDELAEYRAASGWHMKVCLNYGGESMLHPRFSDMVRYAAATKCFELRVITNASLLTNEISDALVDGAVHITVSIHKHIGLSKSYQKVAHLERLMRSKRPALDGSIIQGEFADYEVARQLEWWTRILDEVRVYPLKKENMTYEDFELVDRPRCEQPLHYIAILWNGDTYPCCNLLSTGFRGMGNVSETSVAEVWNGERYRQLRRGALADAPCHGCELW